MSGSRGWTGIALAILLTVPGCAARQGEAEVGAARAADEAARELELEQLQQIEEARRAQVVQETQEVRAAREAELRAELAAAREVARSVQSDQERLRAELDRARAAIEEARLGSRAESDQARAVAELTRALAEQAAQADVASGAARAELIAAIEATRARAGGEIEAERVQALVEAEARMRDRVDQMQAAQVDASAALERTLERVREQAARSDAERAGAREDARAALEEALRGASTAQEELRLRARELAEEAAGMAALRSPDFPEDPADSLYKAAREAMNAGENRRAAELFSELRTRYPESQYVPSSLYYEAFARQRIGGEEQTELAADLIEQLHATNPDFGDPEGATQWAGIWDEGQWEAAWPEAFGLAQEAYGQYLDGGSPNFPGWDPVDFAWGSENVAWDPADVAFNWDGDFGTVYSDAITDAFVAGQSFEFGPGPNLDYTFGFGPNLLFGGAMSEACRELQDTPEYVAIDALRERDPEALLASAGTVSPTEDPCRFEVTTLALIGLAGEEGPTGEEARRHLAEIGLMEDAPERIRNRAIQAVRRADREAGNRLLLEAGLRGDLSPQLRLNALGYGMGSANTEEILAVLADPELDGLHRRAIETLGSRDDEASVTALMEVAGNLDRTPALRASAIKALARSDDPRVTPFLRRLIG